MGLGLRLGYENVTSVKRWKHFGLFNILIYILLSTYNLLCMYTIFVNYLIIDFYFLLDFIFIFLGFLKFVFILFFDICEYFNHIFSTLIIKGWEIIKSRVMDGIFNALLFNLFDNFDLFIE